MIIDITIENLSFCFGTEHTYCSDNCAAVEFRGAISSLKVSTAFVFLTPRTETFL
jgi:hypothetical protein